MLSLEKGPGWTVLAVQALRGTLDWEIEDFELVWLLGTPESQGAAAQHYLQVGSAQGCGGFCCEGTQQQSTPWYSLSELLLLRTEQQHHPGAVSEPSRMCLAADNGAEFFVSDPTEVWS